MAIVYQKSFSGSLDSNGAQKAMPLPALTKGTAYTFTLGSNTSWQSYWNNPSSLYLTYETPYNYSGSYAGQPKNASGSFSFPVTNQKFVPASLINDDYKWSVNGAFGAGYLQNASITFTPEVDVAISESFLRVIGENDFIISIDNLGSYIFSTKAELQTAVNLWISDNTAALATYGEINAWNTRAITDMNNLFNNKTTFNSDISNWDVSNVTNMSNMFTFAESFNQPLNNWDVRNVTIMGYMFQYADAFQQPLNLWQLNSLTGTLGVGFMGNTGEAGAITYNLLDTLYNGWVIDLAALQSNVTISFGNSTFTAAGLTAKNILINDKNWTITDGGQV